MRPLETLVAEAADIDAGSSVAQRSDWPSPAVTEAARLMGICNACRYCEGFCAVFPAMTRRLHFGSADIHYLANLCHSCGACLPACQYASPHEFAVNVPKVMAQVRGQTYFDHAWPAAFAALYRRNGLALTLAVSLASFLFLVLAIQWRGNLFTQQLAGRFYDIYPHRVLALLFGSVFGFVALSLGISVRRFWRAVSPGRPSQSAVLESLGNVLRLQYLDGGHGEGCNDEDDRFTLRRRRFHHFTFYGFVLCFAATTVATGYHYLRGLEAPYDYLSVPVLLGSIGGMSLLIGLSGQLFLNARRAVEQRDPSQQAMDIGFMTVLYVTAVTGFAVLIGRNTQAMGLLLALHLGTVMGLFLTLPYGKFAHGIYRSAALLKWAIEKRRPNTLRFGD